MTLREIPPAELARGDVLASGGQVTSDGAMVAKGWATVEVDWRYQLAFPADAPIAVRHDEEVPGAAARAC